ncbi:MAG TPA: bifunctional pyr operon transcriptional regulator/uracil phosphoribosyltransferase PyrR [Polyangia bacterium]|nr:bifunctional pyr operon transcriptional regulator/uracil phosphoribosyltransferase PyrR [Polyangia bacterium]
MPRQPPPERDLIERRELLDAAALMRTLRRMALEIVEMMPGDIQTGTLGGSLGPPATTPLGEAQLRQRDRPLYLVGVRTGGAYLAHRLCDLMVQAGEPKPLLGAVDISLYRDDVFHGLPKPEIGPTDLPAPIEGRTVVLVDDVLYTGRTIRAAMDVLADYGRPRAVKLVALVDRGRRELPIQPDIVGIRVDTTQAESVRVHLAERGEVDRVVLRERRS